MNIFFLNLLGMSIIWIGVAVVARVTGGDFYKHWQFYVAVVLFSIAIEIFKEVGRREIKKEIGE